MRELVAEFGGAGRNEVESSWRPGPQRSEWRSWAIGMVDRRSHKRMLRHPQQETWPVVCAGGRTSAAALPEDAEYVAGVSKSPSALPSSFPLSTPLGRLTLPLLTALLRCCLRTAASLLYAYP